MKDQVNEKPSQPSTVQTAQSADSLHKQLGLDSENAGLRLRTVREDGSERLGNWFVATAENLVNLTQSASILKRSMQHAQVSLIDEDNRVLEMPLILADEIRARSLQDESRGGEWLKASPPAFAMVRDTITETGKKTAARQPESYVLEHKVRLAVGGSEHEVRYIDQSSLPAPASALVARLSTRPQGHPAQARKLSA